jgi:hypothetical protein
MRSSEPLPGQPQERRLQTGIDLKLHRGTYPDCELLGTDRQFRRTEGLVAAPDVGLEPVRWYGDIENPTVIRRRHPHHERIPQSSRDRTRRA